MKDKAAKGKKAEKPKKKSTMKSGESSKKKVSSKKEKQKKEKPVERSNLKKISKEKKPAREKKGRKVVPAWGLTRGVHPPRLNPFLISHLFSVETFTEKIYKIHARLSRVLLSSA